MSWRGSIFQDIRYAVRTLARSPGFTLIAIATLAVGIGINVAVFTVTNAVISKGFPLVHDNDRILYLTTNAGCCVSYPDFEDWRAEARSFVGMALVHGVKKVLTGPSGFPESYDATEVSADTFKLVGQEPILGRDFSTADEAPGAAPVAILRYRFWRRRFGKDPAVIGRTIRLNGIPTTVIGVMPKGFSFPQNQDIWVPLVRTAAVMRRDNRNTWFAFGRLADGVTIKQARAEMQTIGRRLGSAQPLTNQGRNLLPHVQTFDEFFIGAGATDLYKTMRGAVGFVLLIVCANLANLLLGRAVGRSREIAVRAALGAGRWRIMRQLLLETVMLSVLGGVFGLWIGREAVGVFALAMNGAAISDAIPGTWFNGVLSYAMDYRVFAYFVAISIGTGVVFGLVPARRLSRLDVNTALRNGSRGSTNGSAGKHFSAFLVTLQMALAVVLLAGAGVMIRSFLNIYDANMGFQPQNVLTGFLGLPSARYPDAQARVSFYDRLERRLNAVPGVASVALASTPPTSGTARFPYELSGERAVDEQQHPTVSTLVVSPSYFRTLGATLLFGRAFNAFDRADRMPVAIVNERFASEHWSGEKALGKRLRLLDGKTPSAWATVVGVVSNIVQNDRTGQAHDPLVYLPYAQEPRDQMYMLARTRVSPKSLVTAFRREVQSLDPDLAVTELVTLRERLQNGYGFHVRIVVLFAIFGALALVLASVGLYAVIARAVSQRTQEIGIRTALGASARNIGTLVFRQGMLPMGAGLGIGLAGSFAVNRVLEAELVGVSPADPIALVLTSTVLVLAAALGCWLPARRAMRVDPVIALREE